MPKLFERGVVVTAGSSSRGNGVDGPTRQIEEVTAACREALDAHHAFAICMEQSEGSSGISTCVLDAAAERATQTLDVAVRLPSRHARDTRAKCELLFGLQQSLGPDDPAIWPLASTIARDAYDLLAEETSHVGVFGTVEENYLRLSWMPKLPRFSRSQG